MLFRALSWFNQCLFDPFLPTLWTGPFFYIRRVWLVFLLLSCFVEISEFNAKSVDPDQTSCSIASDLILHCLPMSLLQYKNLVVPKHMNGLLLTRYLLLIPILSILLLSLQWVFKKTKTDYQRYIGYRNFHKRPYEQRFIANSSSCTTTIMSKLLTSCLTAIKKTFD